MREHIFPGRKSEKLLPYCSLTRLNPLNVCQQPLQFLRATENIAPFTAVEALENIGDDAGIGPGQDGIRPYLG
jgi:hypothetical protein